MSKFSNYDVWTKLGTLLDLTKLSKVVWTETNPDFFYNKTHNVSLYIGYENPVCILEDEDVSEQGGDLVKRLYAAAIRSSVAHGKSYDSSKFINNTLIDGYINPTKIWW